MLRAGNAGSGVFQPVPRERHHGAWYGPEKGTTRLNYACIHVCVHSLNSALGSYLPVVLASEHSYGEPRLDPSQTARPVGQEIARGLGRAERRPGHNHE